MSEKQTKIKMIKGKTETGFEYELSQARLENYELVETLGEVEENPLALPKVVNLLLGKEQADNLKNHVRDDEGFVSTEKLTNEIMEVFQSQKETKNS